MDITLEDKKTLMGVIGSLENEEILRLKGYCLSNFKSTRNGFAYITITKEDLNVLLEKQKRCGEAIVRIDEIDADFDREVVDSSTRHGYYIEKCH